MRKRKPLSTVLFLTLIIALFSACSGKDEESSPPSNNDKNKESTETSSNPSSETDENTNNSTDDETSSKPSDTNGSNNTTSDDQATKNNDGTKLDSDTSKDNSNKNSESQPNKDSNSSKSEDTAKDETAAGSPTGENRKDSSDPDSHLKNFDLDTYLNTNYIIEGAHYKTKNLGKIKGTDRIDYKVDILPNTKQFGQEIDTIFKNGAPNEDKRTDAMMNISRNILVDLPVINRKVHIDSVNWVSYDGKSQVMLVQDFEQSTIK
ncbi:hypothetical protein [Priestia koreensis]|uniref:hypothetical protein n=1 Tax=Priestia koreensis TaxID=284581 RepID=UPI001F55E987|nr:hypothetical protein [Priestia koreensis]UNL87581.1 hypothetical protein IE339_24065 [Priestia koreensis]